MQVIDIQWLHVSLIVLSFLLLALAVITCLRKSTFFPGCRNLAFIGAVLLRLSSYFH